MTDNPLLPEEGWREAPGWSGLLKRFVATDHPGCGCITGYSIDEQNGRPDWSDDGFDRAFDELKSNPRPLGLKKKSERAWLMILLAQKNKKAVDDWTFTAFKKNYGL